MKNIAVIFAGGVGRRMQSGTKPKQFLELYGKPIIIYTLELFDNHPQIDGIVVVCIEQWIPYLKKMLDKFDITKVSAVVPGGESGQDSIYNGLKQTAQLYGQDCIVLIHDGVRPLIYAKTITDNIETAREFGNCITCTKPTETFIIEQKNSELNIPSRSDSLIARAPQTFHLADILEVHNKIRATGKNEFIDSCSMMNHYGYRIHTIIGPSENIKITTPTDFYIFRALVEVRENQQIFG